MVERTERMKFLDLFAGIGGFRLGMERAGHECVGFCEIDQFARKSYKAIHNTEGEFEFHDISYFFICHGAYGDEQLDGEYCDQSCGYSEDDYHGVYYYPIGENLYFAYNYDC